MDNPTISLSRYVKDKGVSLKRISEKTGISYQVIRDSLSMNGRNRELRAGEFLSICEFLSLDPRCFEKGSQSM